MREGRGGGEARKLGGGGIDRKGQINRTRKIGIKEKGVRETFFFKM